MCDGVYQLVFLSPEALLSNETWRDTVPSPVYQENLVAVVIDEFYQHSCHVTLGSNVTNYIPLWNENLAHVTRRIFPSLPPPPFPRACAPRGKIRMACETRIHYRGQGWPAMPLVSISCQHEAMAAPTCARAGS